MGSESGDHLSEPLKQRVISEEFQASFLCECVQVPIVIGHVLYDVMQGMRCVSEIAGAPDGSKVGCGIAGRMISRVYSQRLECLKELVVSKGSCRGKMPRDVIPVLS